MKLIENRYYVYILYDPETLTPYYVGKGKGNRYKHHFMDSYLKPNTPKTSKIKSLLERFSKDTLLSNVFIVKDELNEKESLELEINLIKEIGSNYIPSIKDGPLKNFTPGGEGVSLPGNLNGMYGKKHSKETKKIISEKKKGTLIGNLNGNSYAFKSKEDYIKASEKARITRLKNKSNLSVKEKEELKKIRSERGKRIYSNMSEKEKKEHKEKSISWMKKRSEQEIIEINQKKGKKGLANRNSKIYYLISPDGKVYKSSMMKELKETCKDLGLIYSLLYRNCSYTIPKPAKSDYKYKKDEDYTIKRDNTTGWTLKKEHYNKKENKI